MTAHDSTLKKLRSAERETRRDLIINAAIRLFAKKAFREVGMREIAAEAGISPASIYRYFSDRDELFVEAMFRESATIEKRLTALLESGDTVSLDQIARTFVEYLLKHDAFFQMMAHFMINGGISLAVLERFNTAERRLLGVFDEVFRRVGARENVRLTSHAFFASLNGILITFRNYPGRKPKETRQHILRVAGIIAETFKKGVEW